MAHIIRKATPADVPRLVEIIRAAFRDVALRFGLTEENCPKHPSNCRPTWIASALEEGVTYFILEAEGHPCGCAALEQATPETCYLERLAVYPRQRKRGFGQALAAAVIREAELRGAQYLEIGIIAEQAELGEWYRKLGFLEHKTATFGHLPFTVRFMRLRLKAGRQSR